MYNIHCIYQGMFFIAMLGSLSLCAASNNLNHEYQPEIEGSQHPESNGGKSSRNPRIFFGTTTTTTSVLSTSTACYTTAGITGSCSGKRKRSLMLDNPIDGATYHLDTGMIFPSSSTKTKTKTVENREAARNDKSLPLSKLEELNQIANV